MTKYPFHYVLNSVSIDTVCECEGVCKCNLVNSSEELQLSPIRLLLRVDLLRCQIHNNLAP